MTRYPGNMSLMGIWQGTYKDYVILWQMQNEECKIGALVYIF